MSRISRWLLAAASLVAVLASGVALAQETKTTRTVNFEVISVDGNKVVYRTDGGAVKEVTLPADFKFTMDGKEIGLADAKPGMKGTAVVTTTTKSEPVVVTEVRNAEVMAVAGNAVIVRGQNGLKQYTIDDVNDKNITIYKEGQKVDIAQLRPGDRLTATIITRHPPKTVTTNDIKASASSPAAASAPPASASSASSASSAPAASSAPSSSSASAAPAGGMAHEGHHKKLPKTGSDLPLLAWLGGLSLAAGFALSVRRLRTAR